MTGHKNTLLATSAVAALVVAIALPALGQITPYNQFDIDPDPSAWEGDRAFPAGFELLEEFEGREDVLALLINPPASLDSWYNWQGYQQDIDVGVGNSFLRGDLWVESGWATGTDDDFVHTGMWSALGSDGDIHSYPIMHFTSQGGAGRLVVWDPSQPLGSEWIELPDTADLVHYDGWNTMDTRFLKDEQAVEYVFNGETVYRWELPELSEEDWPEGEQVDEFLKIFLNARNNGETSYTSRWSELMAGLFMQAGEEFTDVEGDVAIELGSTPGGSVTVGDDAEISGSVSSDGGDSGGAVVFGGSADIGGSVTGSNTSFVFSSQPGANTSIGGGVALNEGSSTSGGTPDAPIEVEGDVDVDSTSTLGGNWSITGDFTSDGTTSAGNSIGEVHVNGNKTFQANHVLETELTGQPDPENDRYTATGTITLNGAAVFSILDGVEFGHAYDFLRGDEIDGDFDTVDYDRNYVFFALPEINADTVGDDELRTVTITRKDLHIADGADSANQLAVARALDALSDADVENDNTNEVLNSILVSDGFGAVRAGLDGFSGEVHASVLGALAHGGPSLAGVAVDRLRHAPGAETAPVIMSYAPMSGDLGEPYGAVAGPRVWGHISGTDRSSDADDGVAATDADTVQLLIGAESLLDAGWTVGAFLGYSKTHLDIPDRASTAQSDGFQAGLYGGTEWDDFTFRLGASYTGHSVTTSREVRVGLDTQTLEADYGVNGGHVFGEIGHRFMLSGAVLEPFVRLEHTHLSSGSYTESGGDAALTGSGDVLDATFATIGAHASTPLDLGNGVGGGLEALVGYRHALHVSGGATHGFADSDAFSVDGTVPQSAFVLGAGVSLELSEGATLDASYAGEFGESARSHTVKAGLSVSF
ncbi:autotransporter outer membrane beta-barrel domain-containing protein [Pelagibacterium montanilacus]|uniref:autotransporter outer membrane beta-barrel domain-containing protein n=1 Tax=Pelagibacterium montanilacus TaxID=2185280 RepID=UPI000F8CEDDE|nr:autotransporter domain-containing protein [Pelagibacterium montanilacus]